MARKIRDGLFTCEEFALLPKAAQSLARSALHSLSFGACDHLDTVDYDLIEQMAGECVALAGKKVGDVWLLLLYWKITTHEYTLNERYPHPVARYEGHLLTRSIYGRLFASVALWRIDLAIKAIKSDKMLTALNEIAFAGEALYFGGTGEGQSERDLNHSEQRRRGAVAKLARDPTQASKPWIRAEWERWKRHEVNYSGDADFGRKMHLKFAGWTSDRSIAQLSARWTKEQKHSAS